MFMRTEWVIFSHLDTLTHNPWILIIHISQVQGKEISMMHNQTIINLVILSTYDLSL